MRVPVRARFLFSLVLATWAFALLAIGCSTSGPSNVGKSCTAGASAKCACANGAEGSQACKSDHTFDVCVCSDAGTGPGTGAGGSSGACTPGASAACTCTGGETGAQTCKGDGTFDVCACTGLDGGPAGDAGKLTCVPGSTAVCTCMSGKSGAQTCTKDGIYTDCVCMDPDGGCTTCGADPACIDLPYDVKNCGACGHDCTKLANVDPNAVFCSAGACKVVPTACKPGFAHCSANVDDGCEVDVTTATNCGACGNACALDGGAPVCTMLAANVWACSNGCGAGAPTQCNGVCSDLPSDVHNCGACGHDCAGLANVDPAQVFCAAGTCKITAQACKPGFGHCTGNVDDGCETAITGNGNCGACGVTCNVDAGLGACSKVGANTWACTNGCAPATPTLCGGSCTDVDVDPANCGACGHDCGAAPNAGAGSLCVAGTCVYPLPAGCKSGFADCDGKPATGCETDVKSVAHCGGCNTTCGGAAPVCLANNGVYTCSGDCTGATPNQCGGTCTSFQSDAHNCGSCGLDCDKLPHVTGAVACNAGACVVPPGACQPGYAHCTANVTDGCETDITTAQHCGTCGVSCSGGTPNCAQVPGGLACAPACGGATPTACGGTCVDLLSNGGNCGACGKSCGGGQTCTGGVCTCPANYANCGAAGCRDLSSDVNACGGCGITCIQGQTCKQAACVCLANQAVCGGACVDNQTDSTNCGSCGKVCAGGQSCQAGQCACAAGQKLCNGVCKSVTADNANCGFCGLSCGPGQVCSAAACTDPALAEIDAYNNLTCALRNSGQLACWGDGVGIATKNVPVVLNAPTDAVQVSIGGLHACAVRPSGKVSCWGGNGSGQLGNGTNTDSAAPVDVSGITDAKQVAAGDNHTCVVRANNTVMCWGDNAYGELGNGTLVSSNTPVTVTSLANVTQVAVNNYFSCGRTAAGAVYCWGYNGYGQLGDGTAASRSLANVQVSFANNAKSISLGSNFACAAMTTGQVMCWGYNAYGELGNNTSSSSNTPVVVQNLTDAVAVDLGTNTACAIRSTGSLVCWGYNPNGQFGDGTEISSLVPVPAGGGRTDILQVATGANHTCILRADQSIECFGADASGQLGDGGNRVETTPVQAKGYCHTGQTNCSGACIDLQSDAKNCGGCAVTCALGQACNGGTCGCSDGLTSCGGVCRNLTQDVKHCGSCAKVCAQGEVCANGACGALHVTALEASANLSCAVENGGAIRCWGTGDGINLNSPVLVNTPSDARSLSLGSGFACAIRNSGQTVCWGAGTNGQLGNGAVIDSAAPVVVALPNDATTQVAAGLAHACALRANGQVLCWGDNGYGELGDGTVASSASPVVVTDILDAQEIAAGYYNTCARRSSGQVTCWGYNGYGNLGIGNATSQSLALTPVSFLGDAVQIAGSPNALAFCAVRATGAVACWGYNAYGQLGNGSTSSSSTPVTVTGISDAQQVYVSDRGACALRKNGHIVCWGDNGSAEIGDGTTTSSTVPVAGALGILDGMRVVQGINHGCAKRADDSIWCWGADGSGQLGDGGVRPRSTPVEVMGYCTTGEMNCSGTCTHLSTDTANCGVCGNTCSAGQACVSGTCTCGVGLSSCGATCKNLTSDPNNCGTCAKKCAAGNVCAQGTCAAPAVSELVATGALACALSTGGKLSCWGTGAGVTSEVPVTLNAPVDAKDVGLGNGFGCAIRNGGQTVCWGVNGSGQLGNGTLTDSAAPVAVLGLADATQVAPGYAHTCARRATGQVACWGDGGNGTMGDGLLASSATPITVTGLGDAVEVGSGYYFSCALRATGAVTCWGYNGYGQLGVGDATSRSLAGTPVVGLNDAVSIAVRNDSACAVRATGGVACWGYNAYGQLGNGSTSSSNTPVPVSSMSDAASITLADATACVLRTNGHIACWGSNTTGQFGNGTTDSSLVPLAAALGITNAVQVATSASSTCVLRADGSIDCMGTDANGQLGDGGTRIRTTPVEVVGYCTTGETNCAGTCHVLTTDPANCGSCGNACAAGQACNGGVCGCAIGTTDCSGTCRNLSNDPSHCNGCALSCGGGQVCADSVCASPSVLDLESRGTLTCAMRNSGAVSCWGSGVGVNTNFPLPLLAPKDAKSLSVGGGHACAVRNSGQVVCWGSNASGQLGDGTVIDSSVPVTVVGVNNATAVAAGNAHSCAIVGTGRVVCWGDGAYGEMGDGTTSSSPTPIAVTGITDAIQLTAGYYSVCALRATGEVNCWGYNGYGELGDNTATSRSLANVPVLFLNDALEISGSDLSVCAVRSTGGVVCWGYNAYGQLGNNTTASSHVAVNVIALTDAVQVSLGDHFACATRATGTVVCWGDNTSGQFGNNTLTSTLTPTASYSGLNSAVQAVVATDHSCVRFANNVVSCSGADNVGQLGDAQSMNQKVPVSTLTFP